MIINIKVWLSFLVVRTVQKHYTRMLDNSHKPDLREIELFIGDHMTTEWLEMTKFLETNYDFKPETVFYGNKYGWTIRYRKSGRTLCSLFPEKDSFTVLITLGKQESEFVLSMKDKLSSQIWNIIKESKQLRDGRWLWIRIMSKNDISDIKKILSVKSKPKKSLNT